MIVTTEQALRQARIQIADLERENSQLRKRLSENSRHARRVRTAYEDALLLAHLHIGYLPTTRAYAKECGISQRRWQNAIALLKMARLHDGQNWDAHDLPTIESALTRTTRRAIDEPQAYRARLNKHGMS